MIFLDIDGVLNHANTRSTVLASDKELPIPIAPECMERLNRLVVISSSWRKFARWQDLGPALVRHGLRAEVIGETPDLVNDAIWLGNWRVREGADFTYERMERGWEIGEWLAAHPEVAQFVILDDCSDMDHLKPWLVLTHPCDGLDDPDVERAKWLLDSSAAGLAIARDRALGMTREEPCVSRCPYHSRAWDCQCDERAGHDGDCVSAGDDAFAGGWDPSKGPPGGEADRAESARLKNTNHERAS